MAVRAFDLSEHSVTSLTLVERAPLSRAEIRKSRQRSGILATIILAIPFFTAVLLLGVSH